MTMFPFESSSASLLETSTKSIEKFLRTTGWSIEVDEPGFRSIWRNEEAGARVMVPRDREFDDYRDRLSEAFGVLSRVHRVSGQSLALEIASASSDIMFLRADQYTSDGTIPIKEAENLLLGARKMLTAAALSAVSPKANFGPARPSAVRDFIQDDVRMGHTLHGSFVITILTRLDDEEDAPSDPADLEEDDDRPELSYQRRVMTTLATGLSVASDLLTGKGSVDLDLAVAAGVSSQLIDSIGEVSEFQGVRSLQSTFRWSPGHAPVSLDIPTRIELPRASKDRVKAVKDRLKRRPDPEVDQVIGQVVRLERGEDDDTGVAVVDGFVGKDRKRVKVELAPSAYTLATAAHDEREPVLVRGDVTFSRGSYRIESPTQFRYVRDVRDSDE